MSKISKAIKEKKGEIQIIKNRFVKVDAKENYALLKVINIQNNTMFAN